MTHDDAIARIRLYIGYRSDVPVTLISTMLNERYKMLSTSFFFPEHEVEGTINTVDGQDTISLPNVYAITNLVDESNNSALDSLDFGDYESRDHDATGYPYGFTFRGSNLYVLPTPDGVYNLRWYGRALPVDISGSTDLPFPEDWHPAIVKHVAADILFMVGNTERALTIKNEYLADIATRVEKRTLQRIHGVGQASVKSAKSFIQRR